MTTNPWHTATVQLTFGVLTALALSCAGPSTPEAEHTASDTRLRGPDDGNSQLFQPDSHPFGTSMEEWSRDWMRWEYSIPAATNPTIVLGADYDQNQTRQVFFVPDGPDHADAFTVSRHQALGVMLSLISNDFPCPDPSFRPAPGQSLFDFLSTGLTAVNDAITVLDVTLDGVPIRDAQQYRFTSKEVFSFTGDESLAANFDACVTGSPQPAVADALFMLVKPLGRGVHLLTTHIENSDGNVFNRTRTITSQ